MDIFRTTKQFMPIRKCHTKSFIHAINIFMLNVTQKALFMLIKLGKSQRNYVNIHRIEEITRAGKMAMLTTNSVRNCEFEKMGCEF